jgi:glycosyltransferase involved in cell wall biosynthesis
MIALEALAAGVPVIAAAVGGLREVPALVGLGAHARAMTLVRPDDPRALAAAIDRAVASTPDQSSEMPRADLSALDAKRVAARLLEHGLGRHEAAQSAAKTPICETRDSNGRRTA